MIAGEPHRDGGVDNNDSGNLQESRNLDDVESIM